MASTFFRPSRIIAVALVIGAVAWIGSRAIGPQAEEAQPPETAAAAASAVPVQRVSVTPAVLQSHEQTTVLSCVTQADRRAQAVARGAGVIVDLKVKLGATVKSGDLIAVISDEARAAAVRQAQALVDQRQTEYDATKKLTDQGTLPRNQLSGADAALAAAKAALASGQAELARANVVAPIEGIVNELPLQVGQAVQVGTSVATVIAPDPMLAIGSVTENRRAKIQVGQQVSVRFINGNTVAGTVSFVGLSADKATRTYPVQASMTNPKAAIADGLTCEMTVMLAPIMAVPVARSALVFSDEGHLGVRTVTAGGKAAFTPVDVVDDAADTVWVTGIADAAKIITVGQDFVRDGDPVVAVPATDAALRPGAA